MSRCLMRIAGTPHSLWEGDCYLASYDVDTDGLGIPSITFTSERSKAMTWATAAEAMECWRQQSKVTPLRPDGRPNRPLTAFSIEIAPADEPHGENPPGARHDTTERTDNGNRA
jgi:hypothetical protein